MDDTPWIPTPDLERARRKERRASALGLFVVGILHALLFMLAVWLVQPYSPNDSGQVHSNRGLGVWILTVQGGLVMLWSAASTAGGVRRISGTVLFLGLILAIVARGATSHLDIRDVAGLLISVALQGLLVAGPLLIARAGGRRLQWFSDPPDDWPPPPVEARWSLWTILAWSLLLCLALAGARGAQELQNATLNWSAVAGALGSFAALLTIPWSMVSILGLGPPWTRWPIALGVLLSGQMVETLLWLLAPPPQWPESLASIFLDVAVDTLLIALPTLPVFAVVRRAGYRWVRAETALAQDPS